jgi:HD-like signal output (HDOD) protein
MLAVVTKSPALASSAQAPKRLSKNSERTMAYNVARNIQRIEAFLPPEPGLRAHLLRVAVLAVRVAEQQGLEDGQIEGIAYAALLHHVDSPLGVEGAGKLLKDLGLPGVAEFEPVSESVADLLNSLTKDDWALVDSANLFDEQLENMPYEPVPVEEALKDLMGSGLISKRFCEALHSFRTVTRAELSAAIRKLPVFPKAALDALRASRDPNTGIRQIEMAVSRDQVLADETIEMASSGLFGEAYPVGTLAMTLARVGTIAAGRLIATAALKRCFASPHLNPLWQHSFDTSESAVVVAGEAKGLDSSDAFLVGLLHDVGRIAYELTPAGPMLRQWQEAGFPVTYAELLISGTDHAEIGAEVMKYWCFPERFIEAVRFHHRPELTQSTLAAAIYAAEDTGEGLPSIARDHAAVKRLELAAFPRAQTAR